MPVGTEVILPGDSKDNESDPLKLVQDATIVQDKTKIYFSDFPELSFDSSLVKQLFFFEQNGFQSYDILANNLGELFFNNIDETRWSETALQYFSNSNVSVKNGDLANIFQYGYFNVVNIAVKYDKSLIKLNPVKVLFTNKISNNVGYDISLAKQVIKNFEYLEKYISISRTIGAVTPIISLPIFELSHQKLFTLTSTENSEDFFNENQYKKYSATSYLTFASPVGLIGFNYNLACLSKYALLPVMSLLEKNDQSSEEEIYENLTINMENTIIDEKAPVSSKNTMRFIPELMLSLSGVDFNNLPEETPQTRAEVPGINFSKTDAQANLLFASFDEYKIQKNFAPNQKFTKSNFVD
ncbi:hypothetical protein FQR65_LT19252 [Abscondita terminalis]|nr:hypothetical protein FQR65_LT19252 [Abscondita terminalis]